MRPAAGALLVATLLIPLPAFAGPNSVDRPDLLHLARQADALFDSQPGWADQEERLPELPVLVEHVAAYLKQEGFGSGGTPEVVSMQTDFGEQRSLQMGRYLPATDTVELNARFSTDPSWADRPWLGALVHEMVHAEGYTVESHAQLITFEVLASMANEGYPGALLELSDRMRRHAVLTEWWLIAYGHDKLPDALAATSRLPYCQMGCPMVVEDPVRVSQAREAIFDAAELRRVLARERYWLHGSRHDYDALLGSYVAEPLAVLLTAACGDGPITTLSRDGLSPPLFPSVDDTQAFLMELEWC